MARDTRDRILSALRLLLARGGTDAATLENVAAEAGVSKGGLLYHFPSKQDLYAGLLAQTKESVAAELGALGSQDDVVRSFLEYSAPRDEQERSFMMALLTGIRNEGAGDPAADASAAGGSSGSSGSAGSAGSAGSSGNADDAGDPDGEYPLSRLFAELFAAWEEPIRAAVADPVTAEIILQVGNGLYLAAVCGVPAPDPAVVRQVVDRLVDAAHR